VFGFLCLSLHPLPLILTHLNGTCCLPVADSGVWFRSLPLPFTSSNACSMLKFEWTRPTICSIFAYRESGGRSRVSSFHITRSIVPQVVFLTFAFSCFEFCPFVGLILEDQISVCERAGRQSTSVSTIPLFVNFDYIIRKVSYRYHCARKKRQRLNTSIQCKGERCTIHFLPTLGPSPGTSPFVIDG